MQINLTYLVVICCFSQFHCARILGVFSFPGRSHYILGHALMKGLAEAGHDVTIISPYTEKNLPKNLNYTEVVLTGLLDKFADIMKKIDMFESKFNYSKLQQMFILGEEVNKATLDHPNTKILLSSDKTFDAVIVEQFMNDVLKVFAYLYDAPLIVFSSIGANSWVNQITGNPSPLSYIPGGIMDLPTHMTFLQRTQNVIANLLEIFIINFYMFPKQNKLLQETFPGAPNLYDLYYNTSLVLLNSHISYSQPVPLVPNMIEIGGFHVKPSAQLPESLKEFLDSAEKGFIYFSLGSNLKSKDLPIKKRNALIRVFSKLDLKVVWKWEDDVHPQKTLNVRMEKWFPQQAILGHPNIKLFMTHGGLLSIIESVYHGVPLLTIPVFADQHRNSKQVEYSGSGLSLSFENDEHFTETHLYNIIMELVNNSTYRNNAKRRSRIFHDRPVDPLKNAIFWIEHVIREKNAEHLRVAGINLPWYKYFLIDVVIFLILILVVTTVVLYKIIKSVIRKLLCRKRLDEKVKKS